MRDHSHLDELVRRTARIHDEQLLSTADGAAEEELTQQILSLPREEEFMLGPVAHRRSRAWRPALASLAILAVVAVALTIADPQGSPPAIADWTTEPTPLSETEWEEFDAFCRRGGGPDAPPPLLTSDDQLIVADKRGRITYGLYLAPDGRLSDCHHYQGTPGSRVLEGGGAGTSSEVAPPLQRPLDVHAAQPRFEHPGHGAAEALYGRVAPEVDEVTIHLDDGRSLIASSNEGHYIGWWPITCSGSSIRRECTPSILEVRARGSDGELLDRWVRLEPGPGFEPAPAEGAAPP